MNNKHKQEKITGNPHANETIKFVQIQAFKKDLKKLQKKFRTLGQDLKILEKYAITLFHLYKQIENRYISSNTIVEIKGIGNTENIKIYKVRKIASRSIKSKGSRTGLRLIYAYLPEQGTIYYLQIYLKADRNIEDRKRIKEFVRGRGKE